jgi:hypothetical protein
MLDSAHELATTHREREASRVIDRHIGERGAMRRHLMQGPPEHLTHPGVGAGPGEATGDGTRRPPRIVDASDVEHGRDATDPAPVVRISDRIRHRPFKLELCGWQRPGAELVLEPPDDDVVTSPIVEHPVDPEERESPGALRGAFWTSEGQCHLRRRRAREPFGPG